jgi:hypothetical protein
MAWATYILDDFLTNGHPAGTDSFKNWSGLPDDIFSKYVNIPLKVNFGGPCNGRSWYILWTLVYFTANWFI